MLSSTSTTAKFSKSAIVLKSPIFKRLVSTSLPSNTVSNNKIESKKYKFSYESAKNKFINLNNNQIEIPENKFDFTNYKSNSELKNLSEDDSKLIPSIVSLHARLNLSNNYKFSTLVKSLTCPTPDSKISSNTHLSILGSHLLSFYTSEYLLTNYPRLPISILKSAIDSYIGDYSLYDVAKNSWGIDEDSVSKLDKYLANEPKLFKYGRLRYIRKVSTPESNVVKYKNKNNENENSFELSKAEAYSNAVRSIIAGIYIHDGETEVKKFITNHILSRQSDISNLFEFKEPGKLLTRLIKVNNLQPPQIRLISETGRLSNSPIYVVGCFSGNNLLSTGEGSSLREARVRSFVRALKAWYLYKPLDTTLPSDENFKGMFIDGGEKFY